MSIELPAVCTNCGAANVEVYCAHCGEKQPGHHDLTVGHFTHDVVHELVHLDSKLFRTLRYLVTRPGFLTVEYFAGRKKRSIAPLRLFLTLFAIQFLAYTVYKPVAIYAVETLAKFDSRGTLGQFLERKAGKHHLTVQQYSEKIDARFQKNLSLMQLFNLLGLALVLKLLYLRRKRYLVEHFVFTAHYLSFGYLFSLALWPIYLLMGFRPGLQQQFMSVVTIGLSLVYLYFALRRFYGQGRGKTVVKTALTWAGHYVVSVILIGGSLAAALIQYR